MYPNNFHKGFLARSEMIHPRTHHVVNIGGNVADQSFKLAATYWVYWPPVFFSYWPKNGHLVLINCLGG